MSKYLRRHGDTFVKSHGATVEEDWRQVNALAELAAGVPGMRAPQPLTLDRDAQRIAYEWLGDLPRMITLPRDELRPALATLGNGLAEIHARGTACDSLADCDGKPAYPMTSFGLSADDAATLSEALPVGLFHGDCWHGNVLVGDAGDLVLIDPIQSPWLFGSNRYALANGAFDVATMHMSLIVSFRLWPLLRLDADGQLELGDVLLASYLEVFDAAALKPVVLRLSRAIALQYISSYPTRINTMVGWIKRALSRRIIADLDTKPAW